MTYIQKNSPLKQLEEDDKKRKKPKHGQGETEFMGSINQKVTDHWGSEIKSNKVWSDSISNFVPKQHWSITGGKRPDDQAELDKILKSLPGPNTGENKSEYMSRVYGNPGTFPDKSTWDGKKWNTIN